MTFVLDRLMSPTWPFELPMEGFPGGLFCDAHVVGADSFTLTTVLVEGGVIYVAGTASLDGAPIPLHSRPVQMDRREKVLLYSDSDECHGWMMLGDILPESLTLDGISRPVCASTCVPYSAQIPRNQSGMTGNWVVREGSGIKVTHTDNARNMVITIDEDPDYFVVPSGDDVDYSNGMEICSIAGATGPTVNFDIDGLGGIFTITDTENGQTVIRDVLLVPDMHFEYPYFEPGNENADPEVRTINFGSPTLEGGDEGSISWSNGALVYGGSFTITTPEYTGGVELNAAVNGIYGPTLSIAWAACDKKDYIRSIIKTSTEDGSSTPYPLDKVLRDGGNS